MKEVLAILNDRITVNSINGKAEAVSALQELREAIMGPMQRMEADLEKLGSLIQRQKAYHEAIAYIEHQELMEPFRRLQTEPRTE